MRTHKQQFCETCTKRNRWIFWLVCNMSNLCSVRKLTHSRCGRVGFPQTILWGNKNSHPVLFHRTTHPLFFFRFTFTCLVLEKQCRKHPTSSEQTWDVPQSEMKKRVLRNFHGSCAYDVSFMSWTFSYQKFCYDEFFLWKKRLNKPTVSSGARRNPTLMRRLWIMYTLILVYT